MKNLFNILLLSLFCIFIVGCSDDDKEESVLRIIEKSIEFPADGGTGKIVVEATQAVSATSDQDWCTVIVSDKTISVTVTPVDILESRNARITIKSGNEVVYAEVSQQGVILWLYGTNITNNTIEFPYNGSSVSGESRINRQFTIEAPDWVHFTVDELGEFTISVDPNSSVTERTATLKISSGPLKAEYTIKQKVEMEIPKTNWSVPGYVDTSDAPTIGYSSQALNQGSSPNGRVIAVFDGNINSFWHTKWSSPAATLPQWFIIDLGEEYLLYRIESVRRQDDANSQIKFQILTCTDAKAVNKEDPTTWEWEDQGVHDFSQSILTPQNTDLANRPKARYIKYYVDETMKGVKNQAVLAEISLFGRYANH
ncbi:BACON domain-containing protein [Prevotella sp. 10(H)]|uniref:BACON domain-containing protein n=1 Tax=Prevotella sp. 10(H) TaxID=1158294 RepID=UPI0006921A2B|nr:BACON domain-containing carbohydrate-binding protein [Prevotella sp. 10(H)]